MIVMRSQRAFLPCYDTDKAFSWRLHWVLFEWKPRASCHFRVDKVKTHVPVYEGEKKNSSATVVVQHIFHQSRNECGRVCAWQIKSRNRAIHWMEWWRILLMPNNVDDNSEGGIYLQKQRAAQECHKYESIRLITSKKGWMKAMPKRDN